VLKSIIDYADVFIKPLGFRVKGLAERLENDGQTLPAVYIGSGQYEFVNPEETLVYHRVLSGPSKSVEEGPIYDDEIQTLTWSMRAVAIFDFNLYCDDSYSLEDTVIRNLMAAFKDASTGTLGKELGLSELDYEPGSSDRGRSAWEDEFSTSYTGQRKIVSVDYDLTLTGFESCFTALGCGDDEIDIASLIISEYCTSDLCADGTITVNGEAYSTVASGGSDDIPVVNSAATQIGTVTPGGDVTIPDLDITVNGSAYGSTPATVDFDVDVVDSSRAPTGSLNAFGEWEVPAGAAPVGAKLTKTGQAVSYRTGDDGDIQAGRDLSFIKLSGNNPFGHNWRITGTDGSYYDEDTSQYKDAAGTVVFSYVAFPDGIFIDWTQFDGTTVLGYGLPTLSPTTNTWDQAVDNALAYSVGAYVSGWRIGNWLEYAAIMRSGNGYTWSWQYAPFNLYAVFYWTGTTSNLGTTAAMSAGGDGRILYQAKTLLLRYWPVRRFTVTGTTLT